MDVSAVHGVRCAEELLCFQAKGRSGSVSIVLLYAAPAGPSIHHIHHIHQGEAEALQQDRRIFFNKWNRTRAHLSRRDGVCGHNRWLACPGY